MTEDQQAKTFDEWAIVEIFGHQKYAGRVTECSIGGCSFVRLDVPEVERERWSVTPGEFVAGVRGTASFPAFTKLFGQGAVYSITPTTEEIARRFAANLAQEPIQRYELADPEPPAIAGELEES